MVPMIALIGIAGDGDDDILTTKYRVSGRDHIPLGYKTGNSENIPKQCQ